MPDICQKCGLLKDICACEVLEKEESQKIQVYVTKTKFGKLMTVVEGIDENRLDKTAKELKHGLACGGSSKTGSIILQGEHKRKAREILVALGYLNENIHVR